MKRTLDLTMRPAIDDAQKARLDAVAAMPDELIDYTGAPYLPGAAWVKAVNLPDAKHQITLRLDADVLDFFRRTGKRYQTRINAVLRAYMEAHRAHAK
ncbi:MAG: BrnA antitoxin family protein [Azoarcus sp.]|nr:BrnA antitoxin family protein [Azoarcus sp.]